MLSLSHSPFSLLDYCGQVPSHTRTDDEPFVMKPDLTTNDLQEAINHCESLGMSLFSVRSRQDGIKLANSGIPALCKAKYLKRHLKKILIVLKWKILGKMAGSIYETGAV